MAAAAKVLNELIDFSARFHFHWLIMMIITFHLSDAIKLTSPRFASPHLPTNTAGVKLNFSLDFAHFRLAGGTCITRRRRRRRRHVVVRLRKQRYNSKMTTRATCSNEFN